MNGGTFLSSEERAYLEGLLLRQTNAILLLDDRLRRHGMARPYLDDAAARCWRDCYRQDGARALRMFGWKGGKARLRAEEGGASGDA